jgi:hypothetical protein
LAGLLVVAVAGGSWAGAVMSALWLPYYGWIATRRDDDVSLTEAGMTVRKRDGERFFAADDILEATWGTAGLLQTGPVLRTVTGSSIAGPTPTFPAAVAALFLPARDQRATFTSWCEQHDIPYSAHLQRDIARGRRRARLPGDAGRLARRRAVLGE